MNIHRRVIRALCAWLLVTGLCRQAQASPGASSDQYLPPPSAQDTFAVRSPDVGKHLTLGVRAHLDYLRDPIVYETRSGDASSEQAVLVENQLRLWLAGSLSLWQRLLVYAQVPLDLWMTGQAVGALPTATGFGVGDVGLGVRGAIVEVGAFHLGAQLSATLPTGNDPRQTPAVSGENGATWIPRLLGQVELGRLRLGVDLGLRVRPKLALPTVQLSDQLLYGLALRVALAERLLHGSAELFGSTLSGDLGRRDTTSLEALLGLDLQPASGWSVGLAGAVGLLRGYGTPDFRLLLRAQWGQTLGRRAPGRAAAAPAVVPPPTALHHATHAPTPPPAQPARDQDLDGLLDDVDACPAFAAPDSSDGCPAALAHDRQTGAITLQQAPVFARATARLDPTSLAGLDALAAQLRGRAKTRLMISVHLDPTGKHRARDLGAQRARAVGGWLNQHGADAAQIELYDCGTSRPSPLPGASERVELLLLDPLPEQGMPSSLGCSPITLQP